MKYLHIMHHEKFINAYIKFVNENFNKNEHLFLIINGEENVKIIEESNIKIIKTKGRSNKRKILKYSYVLLQLPFLYLNIFFYCMKSEKIFLHSLFNKWIVLFLFIFRNFLKKSYWIIWGGDLYCYKKRKNNFINKFWYKIEDYVKGRLYGYITLMKGDYKLVRKWYKAIGKVLYSFSYPSNLYKELSIKEKDSDSLIIQIGNSAMPTNNHFEIFEKLERYKDKNIKLYCPLSYGDENYAKEVIKKGKTIFEEKFIPLVEFIEYSKYLEFLSNIDIAIFAHDRQQAFGNITSLLSMKKTIYIKEEISTYETLIELGIKLKSFNRFENLEILEDRILESNRNIIKENFSEKKLKEQWEKIFND